MIKGPGMYGKRPGPALDPDDEPTKPDASVDLDAIRVVHTLATMARPERARAVAMLEAYAKCTTENRVTVEAVARQLSKVPE